jgi:acetyl esterase/lipase
MEQVVLFLVRNTPKTLHNYLRDNGFFRDIHDTLGMVSLTIAMLLRPDLLYKHMIAGANILQTHSYTAEEENSKHKIIQEYKITKDITNTRQKVCLVFVHGGAWGSGRLFIYRLIAWNMALCMGADKMCLIKYPVYPESTIKQQVICIENALTYIKQNITTNKDYKIVLSGHSSGANISSLAILNAANSVHNSQICDIFIGLAGVYSVYDHYFHEKMRHVHEISPMYAAGECRGEFELDKLHAVSPTSIAPTVLSITSKLPAMLFIHCTNDHVVPDASTRKYVEILQNFGFNITTDFLEGDHATPIVDFVLRQTRSKVVTSVSNYVTKNTQ